MGRVEAQVLVGAAGLVLGVVWLLATLRHVRAGRVRSADWDGAAAEPELWTSAARCPRCHEAGGLLTRAGDGVRFECLACGDRHVRRHRA
jgi:predicted RNA-binding Zn-ribbon protein involved in translation (DUF1610 family)